MARPEGKIEEDRSGNVFCDGNNHDFAAGQKKLRLASGESVTLMPGNWHAFLGKDGVLIGKISTVINDQIDNVFREPIGRFANIEDDVSPKHLPVVSDYAMWLVVKGLRPLCGTLPCEPPKHCARRQTRSSRIAFVEHTADHLATGIKPDNLCAIPT